MPHKRNPVSFENVKSIWKAMAPRVMTTYLDQISEHQRDLTNSASQRFLGEIIAVDRVRGGAHGGRRSRASASTAIASRRTSRCRAARSSPSRSTSCSRSTAIPTRTRPCAGSTLEAERGSRSVLEVVAQDTELREYLTKLSPEERRILERPEDYRGLAAEVARDVATTWRERLKGVLPE